MKLHTQNKLIALNDQFYQTFGAAFAATRMRIQPGVRQVLEEIPMHGSWLDLGCGNGALGKIWGEQKRSGLYLGLDFSDELLVHAASLTGKLQAEPLRILYAKAGLTDDPWPMESEGAFDGVLCFAALHHIPGAETRQAVLQHVHRLLKPGGLFIHSEWQFQNSPKLMERRLPWSLADLTEDEVEPGDTLLDWRFSLPGQSERVGTRYVHLFTEDEFSDMAAQSNFEIQKSWYADGKSGNLAIYQIWLRV